MFDRDQGPQHPSVKQTSSAPHSALLVQTISVQIGWMQAAVPSVVETQKQSDVVSQGWRQAVVPPPQVSAHVGMQNARGTTHSPFSVQTVPEEQQVAPEGPEQQLVPDAQQIEPVGP